MSLLFRTLAGVDFLHDYFADGRARGLKAVPTAASAGLMQRTGLVWKLIGNSLLILAKSTPDGKLRTPLPAGGALRFMLFAEDGAFHTYSNLPDTAGNARLFFSNASGTTDGGVLSLTKPVAAYSGTAAYAPGDLVASGGALVEAARPSGGSKPPRAVSEAEWWTPKPAGLYATRADLVETAGPVFSIPLPAPESVVTTAVWGYSAASGDFTVPVRTEETTDWGEPQTVVGVLLAGLPAGRYRVEAAGASRVVYYDGETTLRRSFAVLEILLDLPATHTHALLAANGTLRSVRFTVRIPARSLRWRYIARTADVTAIADTAEPASNRIAFAPDGVQADGGPRFLSTKPVALRETAVNTLSLQSTRLGAVHPISSANPAAGLGRCTVDGDELPCAEVRLNY